MDRVGVSLMCETWRARRVPGDILGAITVLLARAAAISIAKHRDYSSICTSRTPLIIILFGCQVIATPELDGIRLALPAATRNFAVDGYVQKPH